MNGSYTAAISDYWTVIYMPEICHFIAHTRL